MEAEIFWSACIAGLVSTVVSVLCYSVMSIRIVDYNDDHLRQIVERQRWVDRMQQNLEQKRGERTLTLLQGKDDTEC